MINIRPLKLTDSSNEIESLFAQLTNNYKGAVNVSELMDSQTMCLVVIDEEKNKIIGFASFVKYLVPSKGKVGRIEDVVIDQNYRGQGLAKKVMLKLIEIAKKENIHEIDLSSRRSRVTARSFYESLGFKMRESDIYRLNII